MAKIMVVVEHKVLRNTIAELLEIAGYATFRFSNLEAIRALVGDERDFSLVVVRDSGFSTLELTALATKLTKVKLFVIATNPEDYRETDELKVAMPLHDPRELVKMVKSLIDS